jgi:hypothetical protein
MVFCVWYLTDKTPLHRCRSSPSSSGTPSPSPPRPATSSSPSTSAARGGHGRSVILHCHFLPHRDYPYNENARGAMTRIPSHRRRRLDQRPARAHRALQCAARPRRGRPRALRRRRQPACAGRRRGRGAGPGGGACTRELASLRRARARSMDNP